MSTIDAAKYHHGNGAETEEDGAWHIGVFLWWCAERGLASEAHALASLREDASAHLLTRCDGKLWRSDLTEEGARFADEAYEGYLAEVSDLAMGADVDTYSLRTHAHVAEVTEEGLRPDPPARNVRA